MTGRLSRLAVSAALGAASLLAFTASAEADTISVPCGDTAQLVSAIATANSTSTADTIDVSGAPCNNGFVLTSPAATNNGNDTGLPVVTAPLTIEGHGAIIQRSSSAPNFRILFANAAPLTLHNLTVANGKLTGTNYVGAGIAGLGSALSLDGVVVYQNQSSAGVGGGLYAQGGSVTADHSTFQLNVGTAGGGIYDLSAPITVRHSILVENGGLSASGTGTTGGALIAGTAATFENDTIAFNIANNAIGGLGITGRGANQGTATVESTTFTDNGNSLSSGAPPGGAIFTCGSACGGTAPAPVVHVHDSIVNDMDSTAAAVLKPCDTDSGGTIVSDGGNLEWPGATCGFSTNADPQLAPVARNGGSTYNYRLLPSSPAIDLGSGSCPATDQRDMARPGGDACDAGAYETHPPQTTATASSDPQQQAVITLGSDQPNSTFECRIDGGAWSPCTSPYSPDIPSDGQHTVDVRASAPDPSSSSSTNDVYTDPSPASVTVTLDHTAPVVTIGAVTSPTSDSTPDIPFTVDDPTATTSCQVDGGTGVPCTSPFTAPALDDGLHTIKVTATDPAGNSGSASVQVDVAAHPPETTITSGPSGRITQKYDTYTATFQFVASPAYGATFECSMDAAPFAACASPASFTVVPGTHTFAVRAVGPLGLADPTPATQTFEYRKCVLFVLCKG